MLGIEYIRKSFNMSLADLAQKVGVSRQFISLWEKGDKKISPQRSVQLSQIFNIPSDWFTKELSELDKIKIEQLKAENSISEIDLPYVDKNAIDNLLSLMTDEKVELLLQKTKGAICNAHGEEYEYLSDYDLRREKNITLIDRMIDLANRADLPPHFLRHVLTAIELLNDSNAKPDDEHETTQQVFAVLDKCCQEERQAQIVQGEEVDRILQLKEETADDDLF